MKRHRFSSPKNLLEKKFVRTTDQEKEKEKKNFVWNNHREKKCEVKLQLPKTLTSKQLRYSKHRNVNIASIDPKITVTMSNTNISTTKRCNAYKFTKISPQAFTIVFFHTFINSFKRNGKI